MGMLSILLSGNDPQPTQFAPSNFIALLAAMFLSFSSEGLNESLELTPSVNVIIFTVSPLLMCLRIVPPQPIVSSSGWAAIIKTDLLI